MRSWVVWTVLLSFAGAALPVLAPGAAADPGDLAVAMLPVQAGRSLWTNRKLIKERSHFTNTASIRRRLVIISMQDYSPLDPDPNLKAAIKAGPIEHGTPLMPYVPKPWPPPPPPSHPSHGASP